MNIFVSFAGIDASGKTTLAKELSSKINAQYYYTPPYKIRFLRKIVDKLDHELRYEYYLWGNRIASKEITRILQKKNVVADRYMYSTIAHNSVMLNKNLPIQRNIIIPNCVIYTTAQIETIKDRLLNRSSRNRYEDIEYLKKVDTKYKELFKREQNILTLDTTYDSVKESLEKILIYLNSIHKENSV